MSKSPKINHRTVRQVVLSNEITGTDLYRCAVHIGGHLEANPACIGKIEDILIKLVNADKMYLRDSMLRLGKDPRRIIADKKKFDRAAARRQGRIMRDLDPQIDASIPEAWHGINPDEYVSTAPQFSPLGGWDDDAVFYYHCRVMRQRAEVVGLAAEQFLDRADVHGLAPASLLSAA